MQGVAITDDAAPSFRTGRATVGASAAQITATATPLTRGVEIHTSIANSGTIYIGNSSAVTADGADATDGYPLDGGKDTFIPINDLAKLWIIGSAISQKFWWKAI